MNFTRLLGSLLGSGAGGMLGGMVGGRTGRMIGSLAGSMLAGRGARGAGGMLGGLGGLLGGGGDDKAEASDGLDDQQAEVLINAMVNSAKSDGQVDQSEVDSIIGQLGDLSGEEEAYLRDQLNGPFIDASAFARTVPGGLGAQAYAVSLLAINVDNQAEVDYLRDLAGGLGLDDQQIGQIHEELGVESL